jgi:hypothetical protein
LKTALANFAGFSTFGLYVILLGVSHNDAPREVDTAWMVQVCSRMLNGELLYRDIFCGTTPLAFFAQAAAMRVLFFVDPFPLLRFTIYSLFTLTVLCNAVTARALGVRWIPLIGGLALLTLWITPLPGSLYTWWALLLVSAAQWAFVTWRENQSPRLAVLAGVLAGLAFCSKPNVGLLALAGMLLLMSFRKAFRAALWTAVAFAIVAAGCLLIIANSGAWDQFIAQCVTGKAVYVSRASLNYLGFVYRALLPPDGVASLPLLLLWLKNSLYWIPFGLPLLWFARRPKEVLAVFAVTGLASAYPRPDPEHMVLAAPALALALAWMLDRIAAPRYRLAPVSVLLLFAILQVGDIVSAAPPPRDPALWAAPAIASHARDGRIFLLFRSAPMVYPVTNIHNPTRYDYPLVSTFGLHGQEETMRILEAGRTPVCMAAPGEDWLRLEPQPLMRFVEQRMKPGPDLGPCRIYTWE